MIGCGAHMISLVRTGVGPYQLEDAVKIEDLGPESILPLKDALQPMEIVTLPPDAEKRMRQGQKIPILPVPEGPFVCMMAVNGDMIGLATIDKGSLVPECIIAQEVQN